MIINKFFKNNNDCSGCMACISVCPKNALTITEHKDGFLYPDLNTNLCVNCGKCIKICPIKKNEALKQNVLDVYGVKAKDTEILKTSQSGGMGFLLGKSVIEQGGTVYGAVLYDDLVTRHKRCETVKELHKTQGSKYVQSYIDKELYKQIEKDLKSDKKVLFTGTPCQCAGVKSLFGKYENLYLADLICHGIISPGFLKDYLINKSKKNGKIKHIDFRDNIKFPWGLKIHKIRLDFINKSIHFSDYVSIFYSHILLRLSCYNCLYANKERVGDITIGDYHGVQELNPNFFDNNGVSVAIINSEKGLFLFNKIKNNIEITETDINSVSKYNPRLVKSMGKIKNRKLYTFLFNKFGANGLIIYNKTPKIPKILKRIIKCRKYQ